jgi:hypothetical protein
MFTLQFKWGAVKLNDNPGVGYNIFGIDPSANISARFDTPEANVVMQAYESVSSLGFIRWCSYSMSFLALIIIIVKYTLFYSLEGFKPFSSLAQSVLGLCLLSCFWFQIFILFGPSSGGIYWPWQAAVFFQTHYQPYWYSAIVIYSFYLGEVSQITSNKIAGLQFFKFPAIFVCVVVFCLELIQASCFAASAASLNFLALVSMTNYMYLVAACCISTLVIVTTSLLCRNLLQMGQHLKVLRFVVVGLICIACLMFSNMQAYFLATGPAFQGTQETLYLAQLAGNYFSQGIICLLFAFIFDVTVQKEIEMSKSGTSSTSSSQSKSSSSSSSSSSQSDPVIEL